MNCSLTSASANEEALCASLNALQEQFALLTQQTTDTKSQVVEQSHDVDSFFMLWGGTLVLLMQCGFAMLSAGAIRSKNTTNILLSIFCVTCTGCVAWFLLGYGLSYGSSAGGILGTEYYVGLDVGMKRLDLIQAADDIIPSEYPIGTSAHWFFQLSFAVTTASIVSGAIAERATFETYLAYSVLVTGIIFPIAAHWVWGGGFMSIGSDFNLFGVGAIDFAGCGPVHIVGGLVGAVGSHSIGPRIGRYDMHGNPLPIHGHSTTLLTLGTFCLLIGWFGFNAASSLKIAGEVPGRVAANTILAASGGGLSSLVISMLASPERSWAPNFAMNGALSGLVSITAGCAVFDMWAALLVGIIGGVVYLFSISFCIYTLRIDDPLEAVAVHGFGGVWGLLAVGLFAEPRRVAEVYDTILDKNRQGDAVGIFYGGSGVLLASQIVEIFAVAGWVLVTAVPFFYLFRVKNWLRVSADEEHVGVDQGRHGASAYPEATSTNSAPPLGNDSVHHFGMWNKYADESVVERTPTGQIIIPNKNDNGSDDSGDTNEHMNVVTQDDDDISNELENHDGVGSMHGSPHMNMNTIIEEEGYQFLGVDVDDADVEIGGKSQEGDVDDWESATLSKVASPNASDNGVEVQVDKDTKLAQT